MTTNMNMDFLLNTSTNKLGAGKLDSVTNNDSKSTYYENQGNDSSFKQYLADETQSNYSNKIQKERENTNSKSEPVVNSLKQQASEGLEEHNDIKDLSHSNQLDTTNSTLLDTSNSEQQSRLETDLIGISTEEITIFDPVLSNLSNLESESSTNLKHSNQFEESLDNIPFQENTVINLNGLSDGKQLIQNTEQTTETIANSNVLASGKNIPLIGNIFPSDTDRSFLSENNEMEADLDFSFLSDSKNKTSEKLAFFEQVMSGSLLKKNNDLLSQSDTYSDLRNDTKNLNSLSTSIQNSSVFEGSTELNGKIGNVEKTENLPQFYLKTPVTDTRWNSQIVDRVRWMNNSKISSAEIQLHPEELGKIEIKIQTIDDQATVSFVSKNQATREILELSLPKLRELLNSNGMELEHSDISDNSFGNDSKNTELANTNSEESVEMNELNPNDADKLIRRAFSQSDGVVDRYV